MDSVKCPTIWEEGNAAKVQFLNFIEEGLKPVIEKKYHIDRSRQTLFGHSFGGLFVLHVLFNKTEAFQTYLASSPSIWWNNNSILLEAKEFLRDYTGADPAVKLLVTAGEWEEMPVPGEPPKRSESRKQRRMLGNAQVLVNLLNDANINGLNAEYHEFSEESHGSVVLPAASRGVRFSLERN